MKKMISALMVAAALGGVGMVAHAQDGGAECQASGRCGSVGRDKGLDVNGQYDPRIAAENAARGNYTPPPPEAAPSWGYGLPAVIANGRWANLYGNNNYGETYGYNNYGYNNNNYGYTSPYPRTSRDRDGDGVPNSRDRYPDDPRYR